MLSPPILTLHDLFLRNAFRVLGLPGEATWSEIVLTAEQLKSLEAWASYQTPWDLPWLGTVRREPADIDAALARLAEPELRLLDRMLWFHERDAETAVAYLMPASIRDALEGWAATTLPVARHDAAIVALVAGLTLDARMEDSALWRRALREWSDVIENDGYWLAFMRADLSGGFQRPASLGDMRDLRDAALGCVTDLIVARAREALIEGEPREAVRAVEILRDELPLDVFEEMCGDLARHLGVAPPARTTRPANPPGAAEPTSTVRPEPATPWWTRSSAPEAREIEAPTGEPFVAPGAQEDPVPSEPPAAPEPAATRTESPATMIETPAAEEPLAADRSEPPAPQRGTTRRERAPWWVGSKTAGPARAQDAPPPVPRVEPRPAPEPIQVEIPQEPAILPAAMATEPEISILGGSPPRASAPDTTGELAAEGGSEPAQIVAIGATRRSGRSLKRPAAATWGFAILESAGAGILALGTGAVLLLLAIRPPLEALEPPPRPRSPEVVILEERLDLSDHAMARLLLQRAENDRERYFLRGLIADYRVLVDDYRQRVDAGLPHDPVGYSRVLRYHDTAKARYQAALAENRVLTDRYDRLIRHRERLVDQHNELSRRPS